MFGEGLITLDLAAVRKASPDTLGGLHPVSQHLLGDGAVGAQLLLLLLAPAIGPAAVPERAVERDSVAGLAQGSPGGLLATSLDLGLPDSVSGSDLGSCGQWDGV